MGREETAIHALLLHAQHHDHIGLGDLCIKVIGHAHRPILHPEGHERSWPHEGYLCPQRVKQIHVRAHHARVQAIAHNFHFETGKALLALQAESLPHGYRVKQRLRWVLVGAITGVDNGGALALRGYPLGQLLRCTRGRVTHDDRIGADGGQGKARILQGLALLYRGGRGG